MRRRTIAATIPITALLTQPLWAPQWGAGVLGEFAAAGPLWGTVAVAVFFGLVALFVGSLQRLLCAVGAPARRRTPGSIWLMFAIPFNFAEDFEIVGDLAASLRAEGRLPVRIVDRWARLGWAWCVLQVCSLLPGRVGLATGALAILAWAAHWAFTVALTRRLRQS